jgi:hypothetical protein
MQQGLTAEIAGADADPLALQDTPFVVSRSRGRTIIFAAVGTVAYLAALLANIPARFVIDPGERWTVGGTVWNGEAVLGGSQRIEWQWSPMRTLASFAFAADWRMSGGATDLAGTAALSRGKVVLEGVSGQADGALLAAIAPRMPFVCDTRMQVDIPLLTIGGNDSRAIGEIRSEAGRCTSRGLASVPVALPPLVATMRNTGGATEGWIAPAGVRTKLVTGTMSRRGRVSVAVSPAGGALLPFAQGLRYDADL